MKIEYPDYYEQFHCLADACPDTCCKDWEVDVDEDTFYYYKVQEGALGEKLNRCLREEGEAKYIPLGADGRCPFLTEQNLCELCSQLGEEGMSQTCQEYPRYYMGIGDYEQIDLSLSCMEVGRLLFTKSGPVQYVQDEDDEEAWEELSEEEQKRLQNLLQLRDEILAALDAGTSAEKTNSPAEETAGNPKSADEEQQKRAEQIALLTPELLPDAHQDEELLSLIPRMDILDTQGAGILEEIRDNYEEIRAREAGFREQYQDLLQRLFRKFAGYLVYRYTIDAFYEKDCDEDRNANGNPTEDSTAGAVGRPAVQETAAGDLAAERRLWRRSLRLVLLMCINYERKEGAFGIGPMIQLTHSYSRQIEHSDENLELWKSAAETA